MLRWRHGVRHGRTPQALDPNNEKGKDADQYSDEYMHAVVHVLGLGPPADPNCGEGCTVRNIRLENLVVRDGSWNGIYVSGGYYQLRSDRFGYVDHIVISGVESFNHHKAAILGDSAARPQRVPMNWGHGGGGYRTIDFLGIAWEMYVSTASGAKEIRWLGTPKTYRALPVRLDKAGIELRRPKAYVVPATKTAVIERLRWHGIQMKTLAQATTLPVLMYRLVDPQPDPTPYEGRHRTTTRVKVEEHAITFPIGSVRVPTDQPLGDPAVVMLEPQSADSLFAWGYFPEILQRTEYIEGYVIAPIAEKMLAEDARLKAEFEAKLAADPAFAANRHARLRWFYQRSDFYDKRHLLYPVGVEYPSQRRPPVAEDPHGTDSLPHPVKE